MFWSAIKITDHWGWDSPQARWALARRAIYWILTFSLMGLSLKRLSGEYVVKDFIQFVLQSSLLLGIIFFPLMRAFGLISQDIATSKPLSVLTGVVHPFPAWAQRANSLRRLAARLRSKAESTGSEELRKLLVETAAGQEEIAGKLAAIFGSPEPIEKPKEKPQPYPLGGSPPGT